MLAASVLAMAAPGGAGDAQPVVRSQPETRHCVECQPCRDGDQLTNIGMRYRRFPGVRWGRSR